jgi:SSS family solute:Na+ symporter
MLLALHPIDSMVLALYLLGTLGVGIYFSRGQKTTKHFFLAGRTMHWLPVSMSLVVTVLKPEHLNDLPRSPFPAKWRHRIN